MIGWIEENWERWLGRIDRERNGLISSNEVVFVNVWVELVVQGAVLLEFFIQRGSGFGIELFEDDFSLIELVDQFTSEQVSEEVICVSCIVVLLFVDEQLLVVGVIVGELFLDDFGDFFEDREGSGSSIDVGRF